MNTKYKSFHPKPNTTIELKERLNSMIQGLQIEASGFIKMQKKDLKGFG